MKTSRDRAGDSPSVEGWRAHSRSPRGVGDAGDNPTILTFSGEAHKMIDPCGFLQSKDYGQFRKRDRRGVLGSLKASGSRDPDVLLRLP